MSEVKLVPARMLLDKETIGAINFHCGDGGDNFGEYSDGLLWVGAVTDDEGKEVYGLHLATAEYPEEGSTTLVEFEKPVSYFDAQRLRADTAEAELSTMTEFRDNAAKKIFRMRAEITAAEQRIALMSKLLKRCIPVCRFKNSHTERDLIADIEAALNQKSEAESHEVARRALKMENQRITPARFKCLACGDYHEGSGNLPCPKMTPYARTDHDQ